ncbi:MAG TPA: membrane protein insertion efficiency factor YidD [Candidatus Portnoybacteria bacterium]|jgi:uncharacterized protein|nr:membrane protein insertion efficiency factor YidD [Candidatus Portnoybacteria bacterium]MDD5752146.1 membrane protein insertion efficiency factor YidD [Candidatus Portnoybacteria bacterium]HOZ16458.1 membrane protein insertion efficiency factor YidD [Candidatus Portnoybacteria bacterium]HPH52110.1 membrane protein insertion efficiency factor YidD [Candidatus Portnoybacteria bacterium]HPJ80277.1 membrane protein insertion efficiency factor YidD [Candidatus Portnoybacteria bacterium]
MKYLILKLIKLYQNSFSKAITMVRPNCGCRFYPSCSIYSVRAIEKYGLFKGGVKSLGRILRCNPFNRGGEDVLK